MIQKKKKSILLKNMFFRLNIGYNNNKIIPLTLKDQIARDYFDFIL